jgi:hypothetical protein
VKLTNIAAGAIVVFGLAACGSTAVTSPTARPTIAPTIAPTPTATRVATTPTPTLGVYVSVTCSNVPEMWAHPYPAGSILGIATWHNLSLGDYFGVGLLTRLVTSHTMSVGVVGFGNAINAFTQGTWKWSELTGLDQTVTVAHGNLTIPACSGKSI